MKVTINRTTPDKYRGHLINRSQKALLTKSFQVKLRKLKEENDQLKVELMIRKREGAELGLDLIFEKLKAAKNEEMCKDVEHWSKFELVRKKD